MSWIMHNNAMYQIRTYCRDISRYINSNNPGLYTLNVITFFFIIHKTNIESGPVYFFMQIVHSKHLFGALCLVKSGAQSLLILISCYINQFL